MTDTNYFYHHIQYDPSFELAYRHQLMDDRMYWDDHDWVYDAYYITGFVHPKFHFGNNRNDLYTPQTPA